MKTEWEDSVCFDSDQDKTYRSLRENRWYTSVSQLKWRTYKSRSLRKGLYTTERVFAATDVQLSLGTGVTKISSLSVILGETEQGLCSATRHAKVSLSSYTIHSYKRTAEKVTHMGRNGLENNPKGIVIWLKINRKVLCP